MTALHLTVAVATLADRVHRLTDKVLPKTAHVDYHIFVQDVTDPAVISACCRALILRSPR